MYFIENAFIFLLWMVIEINEGNEVKLRERKVLQARIIMMLGWENHTKKRRDFVKIKLETLKENCSLM